MNNPSPNFIFVLTPEQLKEQIFKTESMVAALEDVALWFFPGSGNRDLFKQHVQNAGQLLRDFLCCEREQRLKDLEEHPLPSPEYFAIAKPTMEDMVRAKENLDAIQECWNKAQDVLEHKDTPEPMKLYVQMSLPALKQQIEVAEAQLSRIQKELMNGAEETC